MKGNVIEGIDHQYEVYLDYFHLYCYENQDEIDLSPERAAEMLTYSYMGEWTTNVDSTFLDENPLGTAIDIVAEREGADGIIDYESGSHPSRTSLKKKAETISEGLNEAKKKL